MATFSTCVSTQSLPDVPISLSQKNQSLWTALQELDKGKYVERTSLSPRRSNEGSNEDLINDLGEEEDGDWEGGSKEDIRQRSEEKEKNDVANTATNNPAKEQLPSLKHLPHQKNSGVRRIPRRNSVTRQALQESLIGNGFEKKGTSGRSGDFVFDHIFWNAFTVWYLPHTRALHIFHDRCR